MKYITLVSFEGHGYSKDDKEAACLYLEAQKEGGVFNNDIFIAQVKRDRNF